MKKIQFILHDAPQLMLKAAQWIGSILVVVTIFSSGIALAVGLGFDWYNLKQSVALFLLFSIFTSLLFITYSGINKMEFIDQEKAKAGLTEDEFWKTPLDELCERWRSYLSK